MVTPKNVKIILIRAVICLFVLQMSLISPTTIGIYLFLSYFYPLKI